MEPGSYLPSSKFITIVLSLVFSAGVVFAAERFSQPPVPARLASVPQTGTSVADNGWEATLSTIQAQNAALPAPPPQNLVDQALAAAKSTNLTDTVGKTLLVNLSNAKTQGLGDDLPTQDKLIAAAAAQINSEQKHPLYTPQDLAVAESSPQAARSYGNAVISAFLAHPTASETGTLTVIGTVTNSADPAELKKLAPIADEYRALTKDLAKIPVPKTLAPLHLQLLNNLVNISGLFPDLGALAEDPLRGLAALGQYESSVGEAGRVFTNIAQALQKSGIIFGKDEPGNAWNAFLSAY